MAWSESGGDVAVGEGLLFLITGCGGEREMWREERGGKLFRRKGGGALDGIGEDDIGEFWWVVVGVTRVG